MEISYQATAGSPKRIVLRLEQRLSDAPTGGAGFIDVDGDGMREVELRGMCGAGPNCEGDVYKLSTDRRTMYHFFNGGYAELFSLDGFLVEGGRASCCAWEYHVYRVGPKPALVSENDMVYNVSVSLKEENSQQAVCTFQRRMDGNWRVVNPPSPAFLRLCKRYGAKFTVERPG